MVVACGLVAPENQGCSKNWQPHVVVGGVVGGRLAPAVGQAAVGVEGVHDAGQGDEVAADRLGTDPGRVGQVHRVAHRVGGRVHEEQRQRVGEVVAVENVEHGLEVVGEQEVVVTVIRDHR